MSIHIKCVAVGDSGVGRTSLLMTFVTEKFPTQYVPTIFDMHPMDLKFGHSGKSVAVALMDALSDNGTEEHDRLRPLIYPETDVVLVCFSLSDRTSYEHVRTKWHPEIKSYRPNAAIILVGTKLDTRNDKDYIKQNKLVTVEEGIQLAKEIGALKYLECSALTQQGVEVVFEELAVVASNFRKTLGIRKCVLF